VRRERQRDEVGMQVEREGGRRAIELAAFKELVRVQGLGFGVWGLGLGVRGLGFGVELLCMGVLGFGFGV
jgi:hypothetical protein